IQGTKVRYAGDELASLSADPKASPPSIDLTFSDSKKTYEGIYSIDKDTLKICLNARSEGVKERPQDFAADDKDNLRLLVFQREKPDSAEGAPAFVGLMLRFDADAKEVIVQSALEKSPAEKAGLKKDDVVLKVGDTDATDLQTTVNAVRRMTPGAELKLHLRRDGKEMDVAVKVTVLPFGLLMQLD
ncbi:MAG TPA: PDZ domain-containing protein, partial [Gemmataceae bacterium]|nr:PDZ domain-containing protein [Gemmataceae bacterium]